MKNLFVLFLLQFCFTAVSVCQLPQKFPNKTFIDSENNLYVTGSNEAGNIFFMKFNPENLVAASNVLFNSGGQDKGVDIYADEANNVIYVAGYKYNGFTQKYDFLLAKFTGSDGQLIWERTFGFPGSTNDMAYSLEFKGVDGIFLCGVTTQTNGDHNFAAVCYNESGTLIWSNEKVRPGDEVATTIDSDAGHIYIMGTKTEDFNPLMHDMVMLTYFLDGTEVDYNAVVRPGTDEYATSLKLINPSQSRPIMSRAVIVGYSISQFSRKSTTRFITAYFEIYLDGTDLDTLWVREFGTENKENVATSVSEYLNGDVAVSGYYFNPLTNSTDFGTLKYQGSSGTLLWGPEYYDNNAGIDKASSMRRNGLQIAVSGYSQYNLNSFVIASFTEGSSNINLDWANLYTPDYLGGDNSLLYHTTETHVLSDSSIMCVVSSWNSMFSRFSAVKYDKFGNLTGILNPYNAVSKPAGNTEKVKTAVISRIYPNPFNPVANVSLSLPEDSYVNITVFDLLGRKVASLYDGKSSSGKHNFNFNAEMLPSGIYFCRIETNGPSGNFSNIQKMVLLK